MKSRLFKTSAFCLVLLVLALLGIAFTQRQKPVLLHLFADRFCACGEFHEDVSGWVIFNPFRDRAPERSAENFLKELRGSSCSLDAGLCRYSLDDHRPSEWRLANIQNSGKGVLLYYRLTKFGPPNLRQPLEGEGLVAVGKTQNAWVVTGYSSYF